MGSLRRRVLDDEGVTLVEMMVAILILGIVLTALAATLATSLQTAGRQEADIQANAVANAVVEEIRGIEFREVALCTGEATAVFGAPVEFEGEPLVLLPDTDPVCTGPAADRLVPTTSMVQDGRNYDAQVAVTWVDDPGDGVQGAGDSAPQDYKRIVVDLTWEDRGTTHAARTETRRAPEALEQPMTVQVTPLVTRLRDEGDLDSSVTGRNNAPFTLEAAHVLKQSSVVVTWLDRNGATDTAPLTKQDDGFNWKFTVPYNDGLFPNGETLFTFTATDPSSTVTQVVTRKLFLHDLEYLSVTAPTTVYIDPSGVACSLPISAAMRGMLLSDTIDVSFSAGPVGAFALSGIAQTKNGADFEIDLSGTGGFPIPPALGQSITATLSADRVVTPPATPVQSSWIITLLPTVVCVP